MMTALLVDDEPLARVHLQRLLEVHETQIIGEADNAATALQLAEDLRPDLLFLDIQMPGLTGLQMAAAIQSLDTPPLLIFVTGYSEHALVAFEHDALDYLVKPVTPERLAKTMVRARARLSEREAKRQVRETGPSNSQAGNELTIGTTAPLHRLPIREDFFVRFIPVDEIICAIARDKRVIVRTPEGEHRTYYTLTQLESLLPSELFFRVHDSCLVNIDQIKELHILGSHSYAVKLTNGLQLPVSRSRYPLLQHRLGVNALSTS